MAAAEKDRILSQMRRLSGADSNQLVGMAEEAGKWEERARRAEAVAEGQSMRVRDLEVAFAP